MLFSVLFIDGFLVNTVSQSGSLQVGNYPLRFGRRGGGGIYDQWYNGSLDDIGIWNRAITECVNHIEIVARRFLAQKKFYIRTNTVESGY